MSDTAEVPVVIASNRGPLAFAESDGELTGRRGSGGLVSGLAPLLESGRATWIAAAMSEADRAACNSHGTAEADGLTVRMLTLDPADQRRYYNVISNSTLWFLHHGLFDLTREPSFDHDWWDAWEAYRRVNEVFCDAVVEHAPRGATVLVQDYHLTLVASRARRERDDLRFVHFHHTPFAGPDGARVMAPAALREMLDGLSAHDACGFHTAAWESNYRSTHRRFADAPLDGDRRITRDTTTFHSTLNSDLGALTEVALGEECAISIRSMQELVGDRLLIVRVDRMELSKNIVRGFVAYDRLLERRSDLRGRVVFVACCYPSRLNVEAYSRYRDEVLRSAAAVNERWGDGDWTPVVLMTDDDYVRSIALLSIYDVLLVNPIRDGLNLVAKEGPAVNRRHGQVVLSTEAGAFSELAEAVEPVFPFDVEATAEAIAAAVDRDDDERRARAEALHRLATARSPADWLSDQLRAV